MKLLSAVIDGFGVWSGLRLESLDDRMTVFYGPNEAGKTTLLQFVRSMLYGFSPERARRYLPPVHAGRPGGSLAVAGAAGRFTICRHAAGGTAEGELRLLSADGALQPDYLLSGLLGGLDERTFNQVFAVGLREMQELGTLSDSAAAEFLYHLSTGLNGVALAEVLRELGALRGRIVSPDKTACELGNLLTRREKVQREIDELRSQVHRQAALAHELDELAHEIERGATERAKLEHAARTIESAVSVRDPWQRRAELMRQIAALPPLAAMPAGIIERLDLVDETLHSRRRRIAEIVRSRRSLRAQAAELDFNPRLARHSPRIEALAEQQTWLTTLETQVEQLSAEITSLEAKLAEHRRELGMDGTSGARKFNVQGAVVKRLRPAARALAKPQARVQAAQKQHAEASREAEDLAAQIAAALSDRQDKELAPALQRAGNLVTQLRRRAQLDERLSQLARHETELTEQGRLLLDRQLLPAWVLVALGAVFVFGVVLVLANMFLPSSLVGSAGWLLAMIGALGAAGAAGGKFLMDRSAGNQLEACQKQAGILASQIKQAKEERESLDAQLPRGGGPLLARLQTAEKDLAVLEELLGVEAERQAALGAAEAALARVAAAESERRDARRRWQQALSSVGLPKHLSPKQARQFATCRKQISALEAQHERRYDELHERQRELDLLSGRITQLLADVEIKPAAARASEQLQELCAQFAEHQVVAAERAALHDRSARLRRQQTRLAAAVRRGEQRRQQLLYEAGAASEAEFRARSAEQDRRKSLGEQRDALSREIAAALAGRLTEDDLREWLEGPLVQNLEARWEELEGQIQLGASRLHTLHEQRGRLEHEAAALVGDRRLASRLVELAAVDEQSRQAIDRWRALTVTECLLDAVRRTYETERQPEALKEASQYLQRLTAGRYTRIWTPLGERALRVDDGQGDSLSVELLSRGTREQLFLSLRLALVSVYARRGVDLPLVLDDVLVNFDARRAKAAADVLRDFAEAGHQVLVFTCHEHLWKLFRHLKVATYQLPANDDSLPSTVAYPGRHDKLAAEPADDEREIAAGWRPAESGEGIIEIADDNQEEAPVEPVKPKSRRKAAARKPAAKVEPQEPSGDESPEPPHRVIVVRGAQLRHPFADTSWHEPIDDESDEDDERLSGPSAADVKEDPPFDIEDDEESRSAEEPLFGGSDDWHTTDDGEPEAA